MTPAPVPTPDASNAQATTVRVRFRPPNAREGPAATRCVEYSSLTKRGGRGKNGEMGQTVVFQSGGGDGCPEGQHEFVFDKIYGEEASQEDVFCDLRHVVSACLDGFNGTIIAYGQTGSGKTHSLIGSVSDPKERGVVPRAVEALGEGILEVMKGTRRGADEEEVRRSSWGGTRDIRTYDARGEDQEDEETSPYEFGVTLNVVEVYCEKIRDLLDPTRNNLQVKQDPMRGIYIEGVTLVPVSDETQLESAMRRGLAQRSVAATQMNAESSRSHCLVTVNVDRLDRRSGEVTMGKLVMADLAGSERSGKTQAQGQTLAEGALINKSLSCLANVIFALTDPAKRRQHVPFRDSKLTRVLQDSLGGSAKTVVLICCSPCLENANETLSSLRFGARAKGMVNSVRATTRSSPEAMALQIEELKAENAKLAEVIASFNSIYALSSSSGPLSISPAASALAQGEGGAGTAKEEEEDSSKLEEKEEKEESYVEQNRKIDFTDHEGVETSKAFGTKKGENPYPIPSPSSPSSSSPSSSSSSSSSSSKSTPTSTFPSSSLSFSIHSGPASLNIALNPPTTRLAYCAWLAWSIMTEKGVAGDKKSIRLFPAWQEMKNVLSYRNNGPKDDKAKSAFCNDPSGSDSWIQKLERKMENIVFILFSKALKDDDDDCKSISTSPENSEDASSTLSLVASSSVSSSISTPNSKSLKAFKNNKSSESSRRNSCTVAVSTSTDNISPTFSPAIQKTTQQGWGLQQKIIILMTLILSALGAVFFYLLCHPKQATVGIVLAVMLMVYIVEFVEQEKLMAIEQYEQSLIPVIFKEMMGFRDKC
eukprot:CAMPEP_0175057240 /NCGR_PEP_ID=MMETSP0052_2-20121109/11147_1 /TAXON_ID=51329 ORGANISM="Polytomella parva, Strain SAG 63-3" /NCGR_SAMPLE_ID=MMETSP0052_2 /ASSEMBLY_ACC=CAM_ASM_000194 /LENGTH=821 /DNA_ID=CAMNT_0016322417 /DNA_START=365 /DNA_END=2830 /DNA_ORIENTATION=+